MINPYATKFRKQRQKLGLTQYTLWAPDTEDTRKKIKSYAKRLRTQAGLNLPRD